jgi:hypothetical protein
LRLKNDILNFLHMQKGSCLFGILEFPFFLSG